MVSRTKSSANLGAERVDSQAELTEVGQGSRTDGAIDSYDGGKHVQREARVFSIAMLLWQILMIILYAIWTKYPETLESNLAQVALWTYTRDVSIMIFFGFGFLMSFLRRYGYSAIGYAAIISAVVCEWSILVEGFFKIVALDPVDFSSRYEVTMLDVLNGLFCAGAVMISFGAFLGKVSPFQLVILGFIETLFYHLNIFIVVRKLNCVDIGGGMVIHTFGAYFGLACTWWLTFKDTRNHPDNCSNYSSDLFSLAGSMFLWIMWPSFNAAIALPGAPQYRALLNTLLAIFSSTIGAATISRIIAESRFDVVHIQNAILAGGVVMGVAADQILTPVGAMAAGFVAGILSCIGYKWITPFLSRRLGIQDVCGVHNLHGMPGVLGCIVGIASAAHGRTFLDRYPENFFPRGENQAGFQTAGLFITIALAILGGIGTGVLMFWAGKINTLVKGDYFNDRTYWGLPSDYSQVINAPNDKKELKKSEYSFKE